MKRNRIDKFLILYSLLLSAFVFYIYLNFNSLEVNVPEFVTQIDEQGSIPVEIVVTPHSSKYDSLVKNSERLGFSVSPKFQNCPISWVNIARTNPDYVVEAASKGAAKVEPKLILLYERFSWWNPDKIMSCQEIQQFPCEFDEFESTEALYNGQSITDAGQGYDAIVIPRDFAHGQPIGTRTQFTGNLTRIYYTLESPMSTYFKVSLDPRDYLMSYWRGSDVYAPYFKWQYHNIEIKQKTQLKNYAEGRTKMAAIVVSNCYATNNRQGFVDALRNYIDVDVFGICGDKDYCRPNEDCFARIKNDYKFYLAFENCNCRDYITEKFYYNALEHDMIPVVLGAHPSDYKSVAPKDSYIHVEDFRSVKDLAAYMLLLDSNDTLYNEYFAWKGTGSFVSTNSPCELCTFLHLQDFYVHDDEAHQKSYLNSEDEYDKPEFHWSGDIKEMCLPHGQWYWNP
ncbi:unnamed protein product [Allacma fusca]|uniref:Fucosyltransferase n=1 Tax=Allacma fusca TaxID=39272 RepID=A0A8J2KM88_9HEXA|nr:unnamed protein product [Allacma fusca]